MTAKPNLSKDPRDHEPLRPDSRLAKTDYVEVQLMLARQKLAEAAGRRADERTRRHQPVKPPAGNDDT